jgi:hypothetical protein
MQAVATRRTWLRRLLIPVLLLLIVSVAWAGVVTALAHRTLGISTNVNGKPLSFTQTALLYAPVGGPLAGAANLLIAATLAGWRRHFRWWVILLTIALAGTPIAVWLGQVAARHMWSLNRGGTSWEIVVPAAALLIAWALGLAADAGLDRLARRRTRRRAARGICVGCGYDLRGQIAAGQDVCSECGTRFDLSLHTDTAT